MRKNTKTILALLAALIFSTTVMAQNAFFSDAGQNATKATTGKREIFPQKYRGFAMDANALRNFLWSLPSEQAVMNRALAPEMVLPMPDGSLARFKVWESSIMEPGLAAKFPEMRTFNGQGIDDPYATVRFDYNPYTGFHAQILSSAKGRVYIDPYAKGDLSFYMSYNTSEYSKAVQFICGFVDQDLSSGKANTGRIEAACLGTTLRTYRLALACTGEYAVAVCSPSAPTVPLTAAAMLTSVNRVTGVYEKEVSLRMILIANNDLLIYLNGATDPYTNNDGGAMLGQNQANVDAVIGNANYDIGHVFSTGGGGIASLNSPCNTGVKARGVTGSSFPVGDPFDIDYVAHEMGHQWGGNHSMAGCGSSPNNTKYEVGSGTTIQAYAGICGAENIQPNSDPFFHAISFDEISNYIVSGAGGNCDVPTSTGNTLPVIDPLPNNNLSIPPSTPFTLSGTASDANGDALSYCWEQWDFQGTHTWNAGATAPANNTVPLFKSRIPKTTGVRTFPDIAVILAGYPANPAATMGGLKGETLSPVARVMKFRLTVRDNRAGGGGVVSLGSGACQDPTTFQVNVVGSTPFTVTAPNGGESYPGGSTQTVTWNNAGTNNAPYNVANVRISMSTDGGNTYPIEILASTPNDGSESVTIPSTPTSTARIKIEAINNIFFDISNANFTITGVVAGFSFNSPAPVTASCPAPATMQTTLTASFTGGFTNPVTLSAAGNPPGTNVTFGTNPLTPGSPSSTVTLNNTNTLNAGTYTVTITGTATGAPNQTRDITFTVNPGTGPVITSQPASQTVCSGGNATFSVTATGALTYQWQSSPGCSGPWTNIAGATSSSYTVTGATVGQSGTGYRVIVTGQCGQTISNFSPCVSLTVNAGPAITTQPQNVSVCSGSAASFTVVSTGTPAPTVQWQISTAAVPAFTNIPGATAGTYTVASTTLAMNGDQFRAVLTNSCGTVNSSAATLTVNSSITITGNPSSVTICEGTNTSFTVAASGTGLNYQWQVSTNGGGSWTNVVNGGVYGGATSQTLTITGATPAMNSYQYRAVVSNPPCADGISTAATLTINTFPVITAQPQNTTICEGGNVNFSVTATTGVGVLSYQWQISTNGGGTYSNIVGATSSSLALTQVTAGANSYRYRVVVTAGCGSVTSNVAILTVDTYPSITLGSIPTVACQSDPVFTLTGSPAGGSFSGQGVSGGTFDPSVAGVGAATVTYTATNAGCTATESRVIQVNECADRHLRLPDYPAVIVYPNPSTGMVNIRMNTDLYDELDIRVFNSKGAQVQNRHFDGIGYGSILELNLTGLASGTYHFYLVNKPTGDRRGISVVVYR